MTRRNRETARCVVCRLHLSLCICSLVPRIETRTRLTLIIHRAEVRKPTNTGSLAAACLPNSEILVRGHADKPSAPLTWDDDTQPLLLFPAEDARLITEFASSPRRVNLIVPDGNWRQASKVRARVPGVSAIPCVTLPLGAPSVYRLRSDATREWGLGTMEAIARAFGVLEGPEVQRALEELFVIMVERTLWARGSIAASEVTGGVPEGAQRHMPDAPPGSSST